MKNLIYLFLLLLTFSFKSYGSILVSKTEKVIEIKNNQFEEIATVEAAKYKSVRVGVLPVDLSGKDLDYTVIKFEAVEQSDSILLERLNLSSVYSSGSVFISNPSSKIKISANKTGKYKIFVWAE